MRHLAIALAVSLLVPAGAAAQPSFYAHDNYTQYELLDPASHQFAITYYVTERQPGALYLLNQTRSGSEGSGIAVFDPQTGKALTFDYMTGAELTAAGMKGRFSAAEHYIRAHLPRPVPEGGEGRVKILKTYKDEKSYFTDGEQIVFARSLGIARNAIVLPKGYRLVSSNVAAQIFTLPDGRVKVSFENANGYAADVTIRAVKTTASYADAPVVEDRAFSSMKTLFDITDLEKGVARVTHEYVETEPGAEARLKRPLDFGHFTVTDVDSGRILPQRYAGHQSLAKLAVPITGPDQSARLRLEGDIPLRPGRWPPRSLEFPITGARAVVLLPLGWDVTTVSVPATVSTQADGRVAIHILNSDPPRLLTVNLRAVRR